MSSSEGDLNKEISRIKNLKNYQEVSQEELEHIARINLTVREFKSNPLFDNPEEQQYAENKFKSYLETNEIESESDIDTLRSLVYNEVFESRLQKELNKLSKDGKYPPEKLTKQLTDIQNQKLELKVKLGIDQENKTEDELTALQTLTTRFSKYIQAHKNEFTIIDSNGVPLLLRRRVKDFDSMIHPWFAGRWFFNYEILKDVKDGKLSKEDAWRYMCCASQGGNYKPAFSKEYCTDYIDYCLKKWDEIVSYLNKKE